MKKWTLLLCFITSSYFNTFAQDIILEKDIISSGAVSSKNEIFIINATVGQPIIGLVQEQNIFAHQGFWYVVSDFNGGSSNTEDLPIGIMDLTILPNPTSYQGTLTFVAIESMPIKIDILNSTGQNTVFFYNGEATEGKNIIPIDVSNLIPGQYFLNLTTKEKIFTKKIVIVK